MSEDWRIKKYYKPRVLIDTERILNPQFPDAIVCLTGPQLEMLRNVVQYLRRRSTFAQEYESSYYLSPNNADWVTIQEIVSELELVLMSTLCEDLITILTGQAQSLQAMKDCICHISTMQEQLIGRLPDLTGYVSATLVNYLDPGESMGAPTIPATDAARCEIAQAFFYYLYQMYTEELLPAANATADTITAILIGLSTFAGFASFVGLPVAILANAVLAVVAWGIDGSIANFTNWLWDSKDEIICVLYSTYPDYDAAAAAMAVWTDGQGTISFLDRAVFKSVAASAWHMSFVSEDQQDNDTWALSLIPGQCDACVLLPVGCASIDACNLLHWNGGTVVCVSGRAQVQGGDSYYVENTLVAPALPAWVTLNWIPRADSGGVAAVKFGVRDMVSEIEYDLKTTGSETVDVERMDYGSLPAAVVGHECQLWVKQHVWYSEPVYFCLTDVDPS